MKTHPKAARFLLKITVDETGKKFYYIRVGNSDNINRKKITKLFDKGGAENVNFAADHRYG